MGLEAGRGAGWVLESLRAISPLSGEGREFEQWSRHCLYHWLWWFRAQKPCFCKRWAGISNDFKPNSALKIWNLVPPIFPALKFGLRMFSLLFRQNRTIKYGFFVNGKLCCGVNQCEKRSKWSTLEQSNFSAPWWRTMLKSVCCCSWLRRRNLAEPDQTICRGCFTKISIFRDQEGPVGSEIAQVYCTFPVASKIRWKQRLEAVVVDQKFSDFHNGPKGGPLVRPIFTC